MRIDVTIWFETVQFFILNNMLLGYFALINNIDEIGCGNCFVRGMFYRGD